MRRREPSPGELPEILASPAATDEDGRTWISVEAWEQARAMWPEEGWDLLFTLPDEPWDPELI